MTTINELKKKVDLLRELGDDWKKNVDIINDVHGGNMAMLQSIKRVCKKNNQGSMIKMGLTLIAFPFPIVVDDVLGWSLLAAGLIQRRIKNSGLYIEDIQETFPRLIKELRDVQKDIT